MPRWIRAQYALRQATVKIVTNAECNALSYGGKIKPQQFCATTYGKDSCHWCQGDSCGPNLRAINRLCESSIYMEFTPKWHFSGTALILTCRNKETLLDDQIIFPKSRRPKSGLRCIYLCSS
ncbi:serine protease hepsin-like isoform X1 [Daphnia pulex]|uniref:serine protease hepsin-like isoform X1 n=1 Tax=Daphnia pulex TaxID=6669 RepID=UPI001EE10443|nr:serine protease hepsin-like isoform X1 [Daphnia pulex]